MTMGVFDFPAIARKINRQEQKAEFEAKNPKIDPDFTCGWSYGAAMPCAEPFDWKNVLDAWGVRI